MYSRTRTIHEKLRELWEGGGDSQRYGVSHGELQGHGERLWEKAEFLSFVSWTSFNLALLLGAAWPIN